MVGERSRLGAPLLRLSLLGVLWGVTFPVSRLAVAQGSEPFLLVAVDFAVAAAVSAPIAIALRSSFPSGRSLAESAGVGALLMAGINLPLFWGERFATGGAASVVYAASPLVSLGFGALLGRRQRIGAAGCLALGLGLAGVFLLALASGGTAIANPAGLGAFAVGTTCQGAGAVLLVRLRPKGEGIWGETFQFAGGGAVSALVVASVAPHASIVWDATTGAAIAYVGVVSLAIGYALFFSLLRTQGAVGANQVTFLNPVVALALGVVVFGEPFAPGELGGLALILLALALLHLWHGREPSTDESERLPSSGLAARP